MINKWWVIPQYGNSFYAERMVDGELQQENLHSHCLACAKTDLLAKYGGRVDIRGWHKQGLCGSFLRSMAQVIKDERDDSNN